MFAKTVALFLDSASFVHNKILNVEGTPLYVMAANFLKSGIFVNFLIWVLMKGHAFLCHFGRFQVEGLLQRFMFGR